MAAFLKNLVDYFEAGGFVMPALLLLSVALWAMIFERWLYLFGPLKSLGGWRQGKSAAELRAWEEAVRPYLAGSGGEEARNLHGFCRARGAELAGFVHRALLEGSGRDPGTLDLGLEEAFAFYSQRVRKRIEIISVLSMLAPMLGLLGTVSGMIEAFENMMLAGGADAQALSGGISAALITTQVGLVVALPGLFSRSVFRRRASRIEDDMALLGMRFKSMIHGEAGAQARGGDA